MNTPTANPNARSLPVGIAYSLPRNHRLTSNPAGTETTNQMPIASHQASPNGIAQSPGRRLRTSSTTTASRATAMANSIGVCMDAYPPRTATRYVAKAMLKASSQIGCQSLQWGRLP